MAWRLRRPVEDILKKGDDFNAVSRDEALALMRIDLQDKEAYALMETANRMSRRRCAWEKAV